MVVPPVVIGAFTVTSPGVITEPPAVESYPSLCFQFCPLGWGLLHPAVFWAAVLRRRLLHSKPGEEERPGRGSGAFFTKELESGAVAVKLEIWDTAGQEKYHSVCRLYFRGASGAILVYDITRRDSFCKAQQWLQDLEREAPPGEVVVMLVGNKTDVGERREVTFQEGKEFAESKKLLFMEASAKLNHQVTEVFSTIARELLQREDRKKAQPQRGDAGLALKGAPAGQAGCCAH
uniref:RAB17, member RAS onco family n=1 Tax=Lynx canadensis TaxID=61383 RepID=A0A667HA98_LYNCA